MTRKGCPLLETVPVPHLHAIRKLTALSLIQLIVAERCFPGPVGNTDQIADTVVPVLDDGAILIPDSDQAVGVVIVVGRRVAIGVDGHDAVAVRVISVCRRGRDSGFDCRRLEADAHTVGLYRLIEFTTNFVALCCNEQACCQKPSERPRRGG